MAVRPLVTETKMVDVGKLLSLENLLVRKITWFVLTNTSATLIFFPAHLEPSTWQGLSIYTLVFQELILSHFHLQRQHTFSLFISTSRNSLTLPLSKTQLNTRNMCAYTFSDFFLSCSAFSVRLVPVSNTALEISSNPERDKQPTWEKTRSSQNTLLYFYILILRMKYFVNIHFIVYWTLNILSFSIISVLITYIHAHTHTHTQEYLTDYIRIFVMICNVSFLYICWYSNFILFVSLCFECSIVRVVLHRFTSFAFQ